MAIRRNLFAAASEWAERMSNPDSPLKPPERVRERPQREEKPSAEERPHAEERPLAEGRTFAEGKYAPAAAESAEAEEAPPKPAERKRGRNAGTGTEEELRSAVWAGCIMLGVAASLYAFLLGMIR